MTVPKMKLAVLFLSLISAITCTAFAQSGRTKKPAASQDRDQGTIHLSTEEATLPINVTYLKDEQVPLRPTDLTVLEKDLKHQVTSVTRAPASVVLVIDNCVFNSAAKFKDIDANLALGMEIVRRLPPTDRISVVTYADRVNILSYWTSNRADLEKQVTWKFKPGNKPLLYKALSQASDQLLANAPDPRIVILISDGVGSGDADEMEDARQALDKARATVYIASQNALIVRKLEPSANNKLARYKTIFEPDAKKILADQRLYLGYLQAATDRMQNLADSSGGGFWNAENEPDFRDLQRQIIREIGSEYVINYLTEPGGKAGDFREVKVSCTNPGAVVRVRKNVFVAPTPPKSER